MKPFHRVILGLSILVAGALPALQARVAAPLVDAPPPGPSTAWQPEDVVRIIVEALADNDRPYPDAGIDTTFRFVSPANRAQLGPIGVFTRLVKSAPYALMVDHAAHDFSKVVYIDGNAYQMVNLVDDDGRGIVYTFELSRQRGGEFDGMWMTDAVWPVARHGTGVDDADATSGSP